MLNKKGHLIVLTAIILYFAVFSFVSIQKYQNFQYNGLDLAIINQAFYNSAQGDLFASSIHPPSYLGDHVELILFLLLPFYFIWQSPVTLLLLQTVGLALVAWPIYLIAKQALNKSWGVFFALAWLANPFVQNINLFEFHLLPFALIFIFFTFYFYQTEKCWLFTLFSCLAMAVREDVALVIFFFGVLALLEKRSLKWIIAPILGSAVYFLAALKINSLFAQASGYKFLIYYSWLGSTPMEIIKTLIAKPYLPLIHLLQFKNFEFLLGLFLPFIFIPLLAPTYFVLATGVYAQLVLGASATSSLLLITHYSTLILPGVFIAWIFGIKKIISGEVNKISPLVKQFKGLGLLILAGGVVYTTLTLGPWIGIAQNTLHKGEISAKNSLKTEALALIPKEAAVAASYEFLTNLSSRSNIYSLNYIFLGKQQFLNQDYALPENTEYLAIDFEDLITYKLQYGKNEFYQAQYSTKIKDWKNIFNNFGLIFIKDSVAIFRKGEINKYNLIEEFDFNLDAEPTEIKLDQNLTFLGSDINSNHQKLFWQINNRLEKNYELRVSLIQEDIKKFEKLYPLGYGLMTGLENKKIQTNYWFEFSDVNPGEYDLQIDLVEITEGANIVNSIRGTSIVVTTEEVLADKIVVQKITLE